MTTTVLLNNVDHHDLHYLPLHGADYGDAVNQMLLLPTEFEEAQREFPILLRREEGGGFQAVALLGLDRGENLFLGHDGWTSRYVPAIQARGPFAIGGSNGSAMIHVDLADPRVTKDKGDPLFLANGGNAPALEMIVDILATLHEGAELVAPLYEAWESLGLIQPAQIAINVGEGRRYDLADFSTISEARLASLTSEELADLNRNGFLRPAFLLAASINNVGRLADLKTRKIAED